MAVSAATGARLQHNDEAGVIAPLRVPNGDAWTELAADGRDERISPDKNQPQMNTDRHGLIKIYCPFR